GGGDTTLKTAGLQEGVRSAESRYRAVVEQSPAAFFIERAGEGVVYLSPQIERLTGYRCDDLLAPADFWGALLHPDDLEDVWAGIRDAGLASDGFHRVARAVASDGRAI